MERGRLSRLVDGIWDMGGVRGREIVDTTHSIGYWLLVCIGKYLSTLLIA